VKHCDDLAADDRQRKGICAVVVSPSGGHMLRCGVNARQHLRLLLSKSRDAELHPVTAGTPALFIDSGKRVRHGPVWASWGFANSRRQRAR
jgi:hypothetical protein